MHIDAHQPDGLRLGAARGIQYGLLDAPDWFADRAEGIGAGLLRVFLYWSQIEPRPRQYDWTAVDAILDQTGEETELWLMIGASSPWGTARATDLLPASKPLDMAAYARMVASLVEHCGGRVRWWQCENEPSNPMFWVGSRSDYVEQLRRFATAVRGVDPAAGVVLGGCPPGVYPPAGPHDAQWEFFQYVLAHAADAFDAFDIHLYGDPYRIPETVADVRRSLREAGCRKHILAGESNGPLPVQYPQAMAELAEVLASGATEPWYQLTVERFRSGELSAPPARAAMRRLYRRMAELPACLQMFMTGCPAEMQSLWHRINARDVIVRQVMTLATGIRRSVVWQIFPDAAADPDPYEFLRLMFLKFNLLPFDVGGRYPAADAFATLARRLSGADRVRRVDLVECPEIHLYEIVRGEGVTGAVAWLRHDGVGDDPAPRPIGDDGPIVTADPVFIDPAELIPVRHAARQRSGPPDPVAAG